MAETKNAQSDADEAAKVAAEEKAAAEKAAADEKAKADDAAKATTPKKKSRTETFERTRPDGVVVIVKRNIDTGEQTVTEK